MLSKILLVGLIVAVLGSCGAWSSSSEDASREEGADEETIASAEAQVAKPNEPTDSSTSSGAVQPTQSTTTDPAVGASGMVSSANPYATRAGLKILSEGGNAFDAAVAVAAALNVVEPMMSGVGGYGAIATYDAERGEKRVLHADSRMPATLDPAVFRPPTPNYAENRRGAKAISTPGNANAWERLSEDYGDLEWRRLFEPAIELADEGFVLDGVTAGWIESEFPAFPEHARNIYGNGGAPLRAGEILVQEDLARSLGLIAEGGAEVVHDGELGEAIDAAVRQNGGFLTIDDLRGNRAEWRDPISMDYRGYEVVTASPPVTAWGTLVRLGVMGQLEGEALGHNTTAYLHDYAEVTKRAYAQRIEYSRDPDISPTPLGRLLSEEYWADEAEQVNPLQAQPYQSPTNVSPTALSNRQEHTTHFVIADGEGNVVSATQTLGNVFGSRVMPEGTGIWLNDSISYSTFEPAGNPLDAFPGRYRLVGVSPVLVMSEGRPWAAIGTLGGFTILQTMPQMLMNLIDFDMDVQQAIAAPRISFVEPNEILVDATLPESVRAELSALGHNVRVDDGRGLGNAYGLTIEYDDEDRPVRFTGGADPRGVGVAAGY
ncbi:MAG: gamma-glutamyltransferase [Actinomycetota bacterium]|nr:gamma-glutamyltransferase [Actinomycetota bacterium]